MERYGYVQHARVYWFQILPTVKYYTHETAFLMILRTSLSIKDTIVV
jgi:hypothetical protein